MKINSKHLLVEMCRQLISFWLRVACTWRRGPSYLERVCIRLCIVRYINLLFTAVSCTGTAGVAAALLVWVVQPVYDSRWKMRGRVGNFESKPKNKNLTTNKRKIKNIPERVISLRGKGCRITCLRWCRESIDKISKCFFLRLILCLVRVMLTRN
jgi:hypothetical protein